MGGTNAHVVINRFYGGDIYAALIRGVEADWIVPFVGAVLGLYLGSKAMSFTYRFSKGLVGSFRSSAGHTIPKLPKKIDQSDDETKEKEK